MDSAFGLFTPDEFYAMRPNLDVRQIELLNAFYTARREYKGDEKAKSKSLQEAARFCDYEPDIALMILQKLDDHLLSLIADKLKKAKK